MSRCLSAPTSSNFGRKGLRGIDDGSIHLSGAGQPGRRHGQGAGRGVSGRARGVRRGRCGARREAHRDDLGRSGRDAEADRERAAGADGGVAGDHARAGGRSRLRSSRATRHSSPAIRSANIRRSPPPAPLRSRDTARLLRIRGHAMQKAVPVGVGAMAALLGLDLRGRGRGRGGSRAGRRSARPPTTMAAARSWSPATRPRSSARSRSPRPRAPSARCCCRCPRRSIAR